MPTLNSDARPASAASPAAQPFHPGVPRRTLDDLDFARVLTRLAALTRTSLGERLARIPRLWAAPNRVANELALTTEVRALIDAGHPPPLGGITDVAPLLRHAAKHGALEAPELLQVADALRGMWLLRSYLDQREADATGLKTIAIDLPDTEDLQAHLYDTFADDGTIVDGASELLGELRAKRRRLHEQIHRRIQELLKDEDVKERLQDNYFTIREDRYVLPVRSGERSAVGGIIHGSSQTGQTLYIEPAELVAVNNELKLCEQAVALEEYKVLSALTSAVSERRAEIETGLAVIAEIDVLLARAALSAEMDAHPPQVYPDGPIRLNRARNPLLVLREIRVVANEITVGDGFDLLVLTGPNAGGKTVTLGTAGLCVLMARAGLHIPAGPDSRMPVFQRVLTVIGDSQDLQSDLSTFSGHVARVQDVLDSVQASTLVLLDELAVGTEPGQGAALGIAICEAVVERGGTGIVTTHYEPLKTLSLENPRFRNGAVGLDDATHEPTYRLSMGFPGSSSALEIAARQGLDQGVVDRAGALLGDKGRSVERVLQRLDAERTALDAERLAILSERRDLERELKALQAERKQIAAQAEEMVIKARAEALEEVGILREKLSSITRELQKDTSAQNVQRRRVQVSQVEKQLREAAEREKAGEEAKAAAPEPETLSPGEVVAGMRVIAPPFGTEGVVEEVRGNKAVVAVGKMRTTVRIADLKRPKARERRPQSKPRPPVDVRPLAPPPRSSDNTVDVRGERVDEALVKVERFLDAAILKSWAVVFVLHGHGTGRLKSGLRSGLSRSRYVERFHKASPDHGGDAVTVVWLH